MNNGYNFRYIPNTIPRNMYINHAPISGIGSFVGRTNIPKISFSKILNGTSKTLGVINQAIPVFYQVKPIWNNAKTMFKIAKGLNTKSENTTSKQSISNDSYAKKKTSNAPTFYM